VAAERRPQANAARGPRVRDDSPGPLDSGSAAAALLARYRFVLPLCPGRTVADIADAARSLLGGAAEALDFAQPAEPADLVLSLAPLRGPEAAAVVATLRRRLRPGGILALAVADGHGAVRATLARGFDHVACFRERPLAGTLIAAERFARGRMLALADPAAADAGWGALLLASDAEIPPLPSLLFEADPPGALVPRSPVASAPSRPAPDPADVPPAAPDLLDLRRRAVSLVERLMEVDEHAFALQAENSRLRSELASLPADGVGQSRSGVFDIPRPQLSWPVADQPDRPLADLTLYEHRPDDVAIAGGRDGEAFLRRFRLLTDHPDVHGAVAALNAMPRRLTLAAEGAVPGATIIIPVYGQLAYTLNCLDSLLAHASRQVVEILIVDDCSPDASAAHLPRVAGIRVHHNPENLGFLRSCNAAAGLARGRMLVLLNNDTRVLPGWLDALCDGFALFPQAGLVGSKLLYADGTLQEAGAIIWRDGSAWNYGRNDDPNRPAYTHAREVDYVSGASVAVPAESWHALGGFDELFVPAYCEDADLALRIRAAGRKVWYQPQSRVIHYEGRTSGTDTGEGAKAYQAINAKKLYLRWRDTLADHRPNGEAPYFERERHVRRRALVVDATTPTPKQDAGSVTTLLTLRLFQDLGYKTHYAPQDNFLFEPAHTPELLRLGIECAYSPYDGPFDNYIRRYGPLLDCVLVFRMPVLEATLADLRRHAPAVPILFHTMDLHFLRMERQADLDGTDASRLAAARMKSRELDLIARVDCTITHSTFERDLLAREVPDAPVVVWPFMFEFFGTGVGFAPRRDIVFLGGYRHPPNSDAVAFFAREVMPLILAEAPDIRFIIAGANPGPEVRALASAHVVVTGAVDDLRDVFDATRVFVCPLRVGAGTKGKISTAMSYGLPVVSTLCGAEGMELIDGAEVLLADTPAALAAACLRLYRDEALWRRLSEAGQTLVREKHSLEMGSRMLAAAIEAGWRHRLEVG
jgi:GT2 family glycosyltransferase/glycosyltransferase involved in cell wall biosynthesis